MGYVFIIFRGIQERVWNSVFAGQRFRIVGFVTGSRVTSKTNKMMRKCSIEGCSLGFIAE